MCVPLFIELVHPYGGGDGGEIMYVIFFHAPAIWAATCSFRADLVCAVFWCVLTLVWLPVHSIFNEGTYVNVCDWHTKAVRRPYNFVMRVHCQLTGEKILCRTSTSHKLDPVYNHGPTYPPGCYFSSWICYNWRQEAFCAKTL